MRMYRPILITAACLCIGLTPVSASAPQSQKSETIVYIGGEKFYIHTVQPGQTLYSIARLYGVSEQTLVAYNPTMADVLKADQNVKIPVPAPQMQPDEAPLTARQEKKLRKKFILHTVEAHETLYAISKRYGISVETLLEDNENLDPTHLTIGGTLLVRKKEVGKTSNAENLAELEEYKEKLNSVPTDGFRYYVVRRAIRCIRSPTPTGLRSKRSRNSTKAFRPQRSKPVRSSSCRRPMHPPPPSNRPTR